MVYLVVILFKEKKHESIMYIKGTFVSAITVLVSYIVYTRYWGNTKDNDDKQQPEEQ